MTGLSKKRRILLAVLSASALVVLMTAYVSISVGKDVLAARSALTKPLDELDAGEIEDARQRLLSADSTLNGLIARPLRLLPVIGSNLNAVEGIAAPAVDVMDAALVIQDEIESLDEEGLVTDGRVDIEAIDALAEPVADQVRTLAVLEEALAANRGGWLAPTLWNAVDETLVRTRELLTTARDVQSLIEVSGNLLGRDEPRTYLVLSLNNAELRGAGGLLSGIGTLEIDDGRISLGRLYAREELVRSPYRSVPAPEDFERFNVFKANTTLWANASYSADIPDVAIVAAGLFEEVTGESTDGAIVLDPVGIAALMPESAVVKVPHSDRDLDRSELAPYIYSDAYEEFSKQRQRRQSIVEVGRRAFETFLETGFEGEDARAEAAAGFAAGHLRFVSFDEAEQAALDAIGVGGDLEDAPNDSLLVAAQNYGGGRTQGSKLDFWADRTVSHGCNIAEDASAHCLTQVTLANTVPEGLTRYVAGFPYGLLRSYVEVYVPAEARVLEVKRDGAPVEVRPEGQADRLALGIYVEVPRAEATTLSVEYELSSEGGSYSLLARPQPLTSDARLEVSLAPPPDWTVTGPGEQDDEGVFKFTGPFDRTITFTATPDERTGLPGIWDSLGDFLRNPLF